MSEEFLPVIAPLFVYWLGAAVYHAALPRMEAQHRLFTEAEEAAQNIATRRQVLVGVILNQAMQTGFATLIFMGGVVVPADNRAAPPPSLLLAVGQIAVGILVMDGWGYFWHRWTHENKFLYKHVHAMHHQLMVPYAYGAQYIHLVDAIGGQILGGLVATYLSGMSHRTATVFLCLITIKGLDDHCGMWFPRHPFHRWMTNNAAFHALHHQHVGIKSNYSVYYLITWDFLLGTYLPFSVEPRKDGGYQLQLVKGE